MLHETQDRHWQAFWVKEVEELAEAFDIVKARELAAELGFWPANHQRRRHRAALQAQ